MCYRAQMMCSRLPRIYLPARYIYGIVRRASKEPSMVINTLSQDALKVR